METVWMNLPLDLAEHICNQLPKVRRIPCDLKREIESRVWIVRDVVYPLSTNGLMRSYNCLQVPTEGVRYLFDKDGYVRNMCARVVRDNSSLLDEDWWLWFPLGSATALGRVESPIRVKF
jgi:hypothetical protein